jgi:eukaryotic-like serine/threonine-protein kinase
MSSIRPPWWTLVIAASFLGYFALLVHCDLWRPEDEGLSCTFDGGRMAVSLVKPGSPAATAGLRPGDVIAAWNGQPIGDRFDWQAVTANYELDRPMIVDIVRGAQHLQASLKIGWESGRYWGSREGVSMLVVLAAQLFTLVLALVISFKRPRDRVARLGAWLLASAGVFSVVLPYRVAAVWRALPLPVGALLWFPFVSSVVVPALLFTFFQVFPRERRRSAIAWAVAWTPMLGVLLPRSTRMFRVVYLPDRMSVGPGVVLPLILVSLGYTAASVIWLILDYRHLADTNERRRARVLLLGTSVGCLAGGPLMLAYWMAGPEGALFSTWGFTAGTFLLLAVPLSFAYAILRHRLFDIKIIVRQGIQYAFARGSLLATVPAVTAVFVVDLLLHRNEPVAVVVHGRFWVYLALAGLAVLAQVRRRRWLDEVDRRFFRERFDARRLLQQVVEDIRQAGSIERVGPRVVARIEAALHPEFAALLWHEEHDETFRALASAPTEVPVPSLPVKGRLVALLRALGKPVEVSSGETSWARDLPSDEIALLRDTRTDLLVPVAVGVGAAEVILALGPRRSEEPYSREDRELLLTVADALGLLLEHQVTPAPVGEPFEECPTCGTCFEPGTTRCSGDGGVLVRSRIPRLLNGRYRLDCRLGRGGMGTVYAATDTALERRVAVKLIREELTGDAETLERFQREARIAAGFTHPNVVTVHDVGVASGRHAYLVMELLAGSTLRDELRRTARLDPDRALAVLRGVGSAVDAAHRLQLVHRDLKPENILLVRSEAAEIPKVLDFGVAKSVRPGSSFDTSRTTAVGSLIGTPLYMAPEQLRGEVAGPSWDLWALAVIAHELLVGTHPFAGPVSGGLPASPSVPDPWREFFGRALALDPAARPSDAMMLVADLEQALARSQG